MKTLQNKAFWRRKRAVLENQRDQVRNQADVATFFLRSGPTPVEVSELDRSHRKLDDTTRKSYQNRFRYD